MGCCSSSAAVEPTPFSYRPPPPPEKSDGVPAEKEPQVDTTTQAEANEPPPKKQPKEDKKAAAAEAKAKARADAEAAAKAAAEAEAKAKAKAFIDAAAKAAKEKAARQRAAAKEKALLKRERDAAEAAAKAKLKAEQEAARNAKESAEKAAAEAAEEAAEEAQKALEAEAKAATDALAAAAAAEAEAEAKAIERTRLEQEWTLIISDIKAHGVPIADKAGRSDPYVRFTLLNGGEDVESARTQPEYNTTDPAWPHKVSLMLPAGSEAALEKLPRVRVRVFDKDLTDADDPLGAAELTLEGGSGEQEKLAMTATGSYPGFTVSFKYEISSVIAPYATLQISGVKAANVKDGKQDPYLVFKLLEVGDLDERCQTPAIVNTSDPDWGDLTLSLDLPRGSCRPPLIALELWDSDVQDDDDPLAFGDFRLIAGGGAHDVKLTGRKGSGCTEAVVTFTTSVVEDEVE